MRMTIVIAVLLGVSSPALAVDCRHWLRLAPEAKRSEVEGMISGHLNSNVSKRYTNENRVTIARCLRGFIGQIVEETDAACTERPDAGAELVDDLFDRYLLSCI